MPPRPSYWTPDGEFPDHEPNPLLEENRTFITEKVKEVGAELGVAWDGDGDRCLFIDGHGESVDGDFLTALLAESVLEKEPGAAILYDARASREPGGQGKIAEIKERYSNGEITELDGVAVDYDDWHFTVRSSNTEPLLRLNLESLASCEDMEEKRDEALGLIRA